MRHKNITDFPTSQDRPENLLDLAGLTANHKNMTQQTIQDKIRQICTYHSTLDKSTSGYNLSEEQFQQLFDLFAQREEEVKKGLLTEMRKNIAGIYTEPGHRLDAKTFQWGVLKYIDHLLYIKE